MKSQLTLFFHYFSFNQILLTKTISKSLLIRLNFLALYFPSEFFRNKILSSFFNIKLLVFHSFSYFSSSLYSRQRKQRETKLTLLIRKLDKRLDLYYDYRNTSFQGFL